jgi:hypothetical protein
MSELELAISVFDPLPWWVIAILAICAAALLLTEE